jgi:hypothetical protein
MVMHAHNLSTWEAQAEDFEFEASKIRDKQGRTKALQE